MKSLSMTTVKRPMAPTSTTSTGPPGHSIPEGKSLILSSTTHGPPTILTPDDLVPLTWDAILEEDEKKELSVPTPGFFKSITVKLPKGGLPMRLATVVSMSSSGAGLVNSTIAVSVVASLTEFTAAAGLFEEFFVKKMTVDWMPSSMGTVITGGTSGTNQQSVGMIVASLFHASGAYSTAALAAACKGATLATTGLPFTHQWRNNENPSSTVLVNPTASAVAVQSWCSTAATPAAAYTGFIQFISNTSNALPNSAILGMFMVSYEVLFRQRR
jgi:hypothetical protein